MRLASRQHRTLQECKESNTSTEFVDWKTYFDTHEWDVVSKDQAQLAVIASEIRGLYLLILHIFGGKGELPPLKAFLLTKDVPEPPAAPSPEIEDAEWGEPEEPDGIEIGEPLDDKWQKVNDSINSEFAMMAAFMGQAVQYKPAEGS